MTYKVGSGVFLGLLILVVAVIIVGPLMLLWSINTLFPALAIPYSIPTWGAAAVVLATFSPTVKVTKTV